jgi:hypothetical protein
MIGWWSDRPGSSPARDFIARDDRGRVAFFFDPRLERLRR